MIIHACIHASIHPYIHTYMHPCIHVSMHPCIHASMHACMHPSILTCLPTYLLTYVRRYVRTCMHACISHRHTCTSYYDSVIYIYILTYTYIAGIILYTYSIFYIFCFAIHFSGRRSQFQNQCQILWRTCVDHLDPNAHFHVP